MPRGGCLPAPMPVLTQGSVLQLLRALGLDVLMLHKVTCGEGRPAQCPPEAHQPPWAWPHCPRGTLGGGGLGTCSFVAISLALLLQQIQLLLARCRQRPQWLLGRKSPEPPAPAPPGAPQPTSAWGRQRARSPLPQGGSPGRAGVPVSPAPPSRARSPLGSAASSVLPSAPSAAASTAPPGLQGDGGHRPGERSPRGRGLPPPAPAKPPASPTRHPAALRPRAHPGRPHSTGHGGTGAAPPPLLSPSWGGRQREP